MHLLVGENMAEHLSRLWANLEIKELQHQFGIFIILTLFELIILLEGTHIFNIFIHLDIFRNRNLFRLIICKAL